MGHTPYNSCPKEATIGPHAKQFFSNTCHIIVTTGLGNFRSTKRDEEDRGGGGGSLLLVLVVVVVVVAAAAVTTLPH
jgi:hypothetical protein